MRFWSEVSDHDTIIKVLCEDCADEPYKARAFKSEDDSECSACGYAA